VVKGGAWPPPDPEGGLQATLKFASSFFSFIFIFLKIIFLLLLRWTHVAILLALT